MNEDQAEYWGGPNGDKWVTHQQRLDTTFGALTDQLLMRAQLSAGQSVIDVGCGAGDTSLRAARAVGEGGRVLGLDLSPPMLARANARRDEAGLTHLAFRKDDAQTAQLDGGVDRVISRFGVMFFADPVAAFTNLRAAMKPGGQLCMACWAPLSDNPWMDIPRQLAVRALGPVPMPEPGSPGPFAFEDPAHVGSILTQAGFEDVASEANRLDIWAGPTVKDAADFMTRLGPAAFVLRTHEATEAQRQALAKDLVSEIAVHAASDNSVAMPGSFWIYSARCP